MLCDVQFVRCEVLLFLLGTRKAVELWCGPALACLDHIPHRERWKVSFNRGPGKKTNSGVLQFGEDQDVPEVLKASLVRKVLFFLFRYFFSL